MISKYKYIAIDQYGQTFFIYKHPRKELMETCGCQHASKMYVDDARGKSFHVGYIVAGRWFDVFEIESIAKPA